MIRRIMFLLLCTLFTTLHAERYKEYTAVRIGTGLCIYNSSPGAVISVTVGPFYMDDYNEGNWTLTPNGTAIIELHKEESGLPLTILGGGGISVGLFKAVSPALTSQLLCGARGDQFVFGGRVGARVTIAEVGGLELAWQQLKKTAEMQILFTVDIGALKNAFI